MINLRNILNLKSLNRWDTRWTDVGIIKRVEELMQVYLHEVIFQVCVVVSTIGVTILKIKSLSFSRFFRGIQKRLLLLDDNDGHNKRSAIQLPNCYRRIVNCSRNDEYYIRVSKREYAKCRVVVMSSSDLIKSIHAIPQFAASKAIILL